MAGAVNRSRGVSVEREYERHRPAVLGMLAKRFPRFDEDERLAIYHDAWARVLAKRERGEEIESLRAYLLATCHAEAMNVVSKCKVPTPVAPEEPLFSSLADHRPPVEEQVVAKDQARLARDLIDSLDQRQRDVLKLRWDLQLDGSEIRAALGLSRRQYQRLAEEGASEIAKRVEELRDGTWSRRQRSLLTACLVNVAAEGKSRRGIASERQRREAQRLLETDPHFAALYAEVRGALNRAAALLPLPVLAGGADASAAAPAAEVLADLRDRAVDGIAAAKHQATSLYVRAADPTLLSGPRPGTVAATLAASIAVGGGAFGAYDAVSKPAPESAPVRATRPELPVRPIAIAPLPTAASAARIRRAATRPRSQDVDSTSATPITPPPSPAATTPPAPQPIQPPQPPPNPTEFGFEN